MHEPSDELYADYWEETRGLPECRCRDASECRGVSEMEGCWALRNERAQEASERALSDTEDPDDA